MIEKIPNGFSRKVKHFWIFMGINMGISLFLGIFG
jgi:hypothetical protein